MPAATDSRSRVSRYLAEPANRWYAAAATVVLAVLVVFVVLGVYVTPAGFDESYVVQAPWNLVDGLGYSTFDWYRGTTPRVFDTLISTGPVVLLPISIAFAAFGVGIEQVRWTMVPFLVLLVVVTWLLGRRIGGRWVALAAVAAVLTLNLRVDLPHTATWSVVDGLGELPTAAFLVLGVLLLRRSPGSAGLAIGLAALCKLIAFIAVPGFILALLFAFPDRTRRERIRSVLVFGVAGLAPTAVWELVKLVSLGWGGYLQNLKSYASFVIASGSGLPATAGGPQDVLGRVSYLAGAWFLPWGLALACFAVLIALTVVLLRRRAAAGEPTLRPEWIAGLGALALYVVWWVGFSDSFFARHVFPGLLLIPAVLAPFAAAGAARLARAGNGWLRPVGIGMLALGVVIGAAQVTQHIAQDLGSTPYTRGDQQAAVDAIRDVAPDGVQHVGYWSNPELRLLGDIHSMPFPAGDGPLVLSPQMALIAPDLYAAASARCVDVLYERDGFLVCSVDPDDDVPLE